MRKSRLLRIEKPGGQKLVQDTSPPSYGDIPSISPCTKKRVRRVADPHLEARKINGHVYYYYRRGVDTPVYLGTADSILEVVGAARSQNMTGRKRS